MNLKTNEFLKSNLFIVFKRETSHTLEVENAEDSAVYSSAKEVVKLRHLLPKEQVLIFNCRGVKIKVDYRITWVDINNIYWLIVDSKSMAEAKAKVESYKERNNLIKHKKVDQ